MNSVLLYQYKNEQRLCAVKAVCQVRSLTREWGKALPKPRIDQYRVHREADSLAKASHWGNLRRQNLIRLRCESGDLLKRHFYAPRQNVALEWLW